MVKEMGPQFFHGTTADIPDKVLPATVHGKGSRWGKTGIELGQPSEDHAFATSREDVAWHFAGSYKDVALPEENNRRHVYEVEPHPEMREGVNAKRDAPGEVVAPHFDIKQRIDTKPGRQGTFPHLNWNQFRDDSSDWEAENTDTNHPTDSQINYGGGTKGRDLGGAAYEERTRQAQLANQPLNHMEPYGHPDDVDLFTGKTAKEMSSNANPEYEWGADQGNPVPGYEYKTPDYFRRSFEGEGVGSTKLQKSPK